MELNIGDKFVGIISGTVYTYVGFKKSVAVLRDMSTGLCHDATEQSLKEYYKPYKKTVAVEIRQRRYSLVPLGSSFVNMLVQGQSTDHNVANKSDGSSADYYKLPANAAQLQDLISHKDMNAQMGEIFRAAYRYGQASHSDQLRDAKKIKYYIEAEIKRLEALK